MAVGGDRPWQPFEPTEWSQLVAMFPYTEVLFEPGTQYRYSNPGIVLLGRIIETLTGSGFQGAGFGVRFGFGVRHRLLGGSRHQFYRRKTSCAGEPTGVYCPVNVNAPDFGLILKLVIASDRWLQENRNRPDGSIVKLRG